MKPSFPLQLLWNSQTLATAPTSTLFITFMVWELYNYFRLITSLPMLVGAHFAQNCADTDETIWYSTKGCELTPIRELRLTDAVDKSMVGILHITNLRLCSGFSRREKKNLNTKTRCESAQLCEQMPQRARGKFSRGVRSIPSTRGLAPSSDTLLS